MFRPILQKSRRPALIQIMQTMASSTSTTITTTGDTTTTTTTAGAGIITPTMETKSYNQHSVHQYDAHLGCQHLLEGVLERFAKRIAFEDNNNAEDIAGRRRRRHIVDLGVADGRNSIRTLKWAIQNLKDQLQHQQLLPPLKITLEEHPASDRNILQRTIDDHWEWFHSNGIQQQPSLLFQSFYEPLFPPSSVDLLLSYICLHWLDTAGSDNNNKNSVAEWKTWARAATSSSSSSSLWEKSKHHDDNTSILKNFVFMTEDTAPKQARKLWRDKLATKHLATFLALRAQELRPGSEALLMMVGSPNMFITPSSSSSSSSPSPLTLAMQTCVQNGTLREQILEKTFVPYFNRTKSDVKDALEMAATIPIRKHSTSSSSSSSSGEDEMEYPGSFLRLIELLSYPVSIGKGGTTSNNNDTNCIQGSFDMFWSIHQGAVRGAGATDDEMEAIRLETREWFHKLYDPNQGISITFIACVVRRQTRKAW